MSERGQDRLRFATDILFGLDIATTNQIVGPSLTSRNGWRHDTADVPDQAERILTVERP